MFNIANHQGNTNQNYEITSHIYQMAIIKKVITTVGEDVGDMEPLCTVGRTIN